MKVVLLAGGYGTRIPEESINKPKPMIEIGDMPIIWHIMKIYSYYGFTDFIICAGYKQRMIKEWFSNYNIYNSDVTFHYGKNGTSCEIHKQYGEEWNVTIVDTGLDTSTGGRIKRVQSYIGDKPFFMTYGDGLCDVNINELLKFHKNHGKIATLTSVRRNQTKGVISITEDNSVRAFREKSIVDGVPINAGYMVLNPAIFDYIEGDDTVFEKEPMERLAMAGELKSFQHRGFWQCMGNIREKKILEEMLLRGKAPWKKWRD